MNKEGASLIRHLQDENALLREKTSLFQGQIEDLQEKIEERDSIIAELKEENQKLRLAIYGINPIRKKASNTGKENSGPKKLGPPNGHKGTSRKRPNRVDRTVVLKPGRCPYCNGEISDLKGVRERFVEDIIPVTLFVTRYVIKQGYCKRCHKIVYPEVPEVIDNCHFGIHLLLYITYLRFVMNLPYNKIATLLNDTYGAEISEGTIVDYIKRAAEVFGPEYERIKREMRSLNCHYDDTGQRVAGNNRWLWVFISKEAMLYHTSKSRSKNVVIEILGDDYGGVTVQDFYPSYDGAPGLKQKCWAHLLRDVRELAEKKHPPPEATPFYKELRQIYINARDVVENLQTAEEREKEYSSYVERLEHLASMDYQNPDVKRLSKRIRKYKHELCTFILVPDVEPTNNPAERALRPAVVQRKIWGCHRTWEGAENRDIIMSVMGTMKLQGKNFFIDGKEHVLNALT